jgi:hypothetical protein
MSQGVGSETGKAAGCRRSTSVAAVSGWCGAAMGRPVAAYSNTVPLVTYFLRLMWILACVSMRASADVFEKEMSSRRERTRSGPSGVP